LHTQDVRTDGRCLQSLINKAYTYPAGYRSAGMVEYDSIV